MISIKPANEVKLDYEDVIRHSPVADEPNAVEMFKKFVNKSQCAYVGYINDEVACVYGLEAPTLMSTTKVYLWMMPTDVVDRNKFEFIRNSEVIIENVLKEYEIIHGHTHVKDTRAFKWLRWLGAVYCEGRPLVPFYITQSTFESRRRRRWQTP